MHSVWNALSGCLWASFGLVVNAESQKSSAKFLILIDLNMKQMESNAMSLWAECGRVLKFKGERCEMVHERSWLSFLKGIELIRLLIVMAILKGLLIANCSQKAVLSQVFPYQP